MLCLRGEEAQEQKKLLDAIERDEKRLIAITTKELDKSPNSADLVCELGQLYLRFNNKQRGVVWLQRALKLDPKHGS